MNKIKHMSLVLPMDEDGIWLACKKAKSFGHGKYNGAGGKYVVPELLISGAEREMKEEFGITARQLEKVAELIFKGPAATDVDRVVHAYFARGLHFGERLCDEMGDLQHFPFHEIPYDGMWGTDLSWYVPTLAGLKVKGEYTFNPDETFTIDRLDFVKDFERQI